MNYCLGPSSKTTKGMWKTVTWTAPKRRKVYTTQNKSTDQGCLCYFQTPHSVFIYSVLIRHYQTRIRFLKDRSWPVITDSQMLASQCGFTGFTVDNFLCCTLSSETTIRYLKYFTAQKNLF